MTASDRRPSRLDPAHVETGSITHRICEVCGQAVDLSDPDQIFHHRPEAHEQMG